MTVKERMEGYWCIPVHNGQGCFNRERIEKGTNQSGMEQTHLSLAEKISQGILLDALPYVDKEV